MSKRKDFTILQYLSPCNCFRRKWRWCLSRNLAFLISIHWRIIDRLNQSKIYFQVEFSNRHISNHIPLFRILFIDILLLSQISFKCFFMPDFHFRLLHSLKLKIAFQDLNFEISAVNVIFWKVDCTVPNFGWVASSFLPPNLAHKYYMAIDVYIWLSFIEMSLGFFLDRTFMLSIGLH